MTPPPVYSRYQAVPPASPRVAPRQERAAPRRGALHVGESSFGISGMTHRSQYANGEGYSDPGLRFTLKHRNTKHVGVELSGGMAGTNFYSLEGRSDRRVSIPVQLSASYHLFPKSSIQPYGLVGLTLEARDFQQVAYDGGAFYYSEERFQDMRMGSHVGLGLEWMLGEDLSLNADARWVNFSLASDQSLEQTSPYGLTTNIGLNFFF